MLAILLASADLDGQMQRTDAAVEKSARSISPHTTYDGIFSLGVAFFFRTNI
jgi:hypothetical protein